MPPKKLPLMAEHNEAHNLGADDFAAFFRDIHDCEPFPWQQRLTAHVLTRNEWPKVIDLPTGTGKTAVLDTAVFALAVRHSHAPRRIVFVIDRRIVVDQVCERAQRIAERVEDARTPVLKCVRERLHALSGGNPLRVAALRGGIPLDNDWAHRPDQPWIMVSTVDQFGSRLLFRGYGVTSGMRPIHAGLAGNDCLVILDEVHLSMPFAQTLAAVSALPSPSELPRRFAVVEMSATPSDRKADRFTLDSVVDIDGCEELRLRVSARKEARLQSVQRPDNLPAAIVRIVGSVNRDARKAGQSPGSIGVVVNRVRTARDTFRALGEAGCSAFLLTGRMRPLDRARILAAIGPAVAPDRETSKELTVVVATQAIEVGADFSFDALITECAPVDCLRQRFGRLDRRGRIFARTGEAAQAWILGPKSIVASKKGDPIYGHAVKATWDELERRAVERLVDVGPLALVDFPEEATAPRRRAPLLLDTHMDAWVQTRPEPVVQPSVEWFLHGMSEDNISPEVFVVWRRDQSIDALRLVPPRQAEFLPVPIDAVKSWLAGGPEMEVADAPRSEAGDSSLGVSNHEASVVCVRWEGFGEEPSRVSVGDIRPGDILVVNTVQGGLSAGTWDPTARDTVSDLGDAAQLAYGQRATLRLDPELEGVESPPLPWQESEADEPLRERIELWLDQQELDDDEHNFMAKAVTSLRRGFVHAMIGAGDSTDNKAYYVLVQSSAANERQAVDEALLDGSDEAGSLTGAGVPLRCHLEGVGKRVADIGERLGIPPKLVADLRLSGRLHDLGKVDGRFQEQLVGGDPVEMAMRKEPLAKSLPGTRWVRCYPKGMRHELASVALAASNDAVLDAAHDRDLVLHLIGTHHGWARPLPPVIEDIAPQELAYVVDGHALASSSNLAEGSLALDMADRFWRLVERYGHHGLAWLEAILRLADHQQSAHEAEQA